MRSPILALALAAAAPALAQEASPPPPVPTPTAEAPAAPTPAAAPVGAAAPEATPAPERAEAPVPTPAPPAGNAELAAMQAELAAMREALAAQQAAMQAQADDLARTKLAMVKPEKAVFSLEGYYRTRGNVFYNTFASQTDGEDREVGRYMAHRLKVRPKVDYKGLAKFMMEFDAFGNPQFGEADAIWGDNASLQATPPFATDASFANYRGRETAGGPKLTRAWTEFTVPLGVLRVGRQPSDWGMGLLANGGDGFDDTFGENHYGASFDRAIFATKPISVFNGLTGRADKGIPLFAAVGVDRLVEDPLFQYYGYKCTEGVDDTDRRWDPRCDTNGDGITDVEHSYQDESRTPDQRRPDWWVDSDDDVWEMVYVLVYRGENVKYLGGTGDLTAGTYAVNRIQRETNTNLWILDAYLKAKVHGVYAEFEGYVIRGETSAIALPGAYDPTGTGADPLYKQAAIGSYVGRLGYVQPSWKVMMEHGYASGDQNVADERFTVRPIAPDHNVGLILYEQVLARVTAAGWTDRALALWSQGGVYNSRYIFPTAHWFPIDNWEVLGGFLMAWPHEPDGAFIQCLPGEGCADARATQNALGWEADVGLKIKFHQHVRFSLEGGYAKATDRLPLQLAGLDPEGKYMTVQSRIAYEF
jgi:hypothetical protein